MLPKMKIFIEHPDTHEPVPASEWILRDDRTNAQWLIVEVGTPSFSFKLHKQELGIFTWPEAIEACSAKGGRPGTRAELLALYDARYGHGLNEILNAIGGHPMKGWYWTEEEDADPQCSQQYAWLVDLYRGNVGYLAKARGYQVRLVSAL